MVRASRSGAVMLLWLLLALLPLRGWAQGTMALAAAAAPAQALPCHGEMAGHPTGHLAALDGDSTPSSACSHCDLCHAAAPTEVPVQATQALPDGAPAVMVSRAPATARVDSLFRPPRP